MTDISQHNAYRGPAPQQHTEQNPNYQQQNAHYPQQHANHQQQNAHYPQQHANHQQQNAHYPQQHANHQQQNAHYPQQHANHQQQNAHYPQQQANHQQQNANNNQTPRSFAAPYTAKVFGGEAKFQAVPTLAFYPRAYATVAARFTPIPSVLSAGVSATARFDPAITLRPTDAGGFQVSFIPRMQLAANIDLKAGLPNILGTGLNVHAGGRLTQLLNFSAPEFSATLEPTGAFKANANFNPTLSTQQFAGVEGGLEGNVSVPLPGPIPGLTAGAGGGISQSFTGGPEHEIKLGGPGVEFALSPTGQPSITQNFDRTVSVTNSYTFLPRTSINANVHAGPGTVTAGAGVTPTFTVQHKVTFSTELANKITPKHEFSVTPGVTVDGSLAFRVSLLPRDWPVSLTGEVGFDPRAAATVRGSYTV